MLDKIIVSVDRKTALIVFDTHSVTFTHSEGKVIELVNEILLEPSIKLDDRYRSAEEITLVIELDLQLSLFKDVA